MRDVARFRTGPDGTLILAPSLGSGLDAEDLTVTLAGRTIEISTPEETIIQLEVVHGETV